MQHYVVEKQGGNHILNSISQTHVKKISWVPVPKCMMFLESESKLHSVSRAQQRRGPHWSSKGWREEGSDSQPPATSRAQ